MRNNGILDALCDVVGRIFTTLLYVFIRVFGRSVNKEGVPWLACPTGGSDRIGPDFYETLAAAEGLELRTGENAGLLPSFEVLRGPDFDPSQLRPEVRDFYEHTSRYRLEAWSDVSLSTRLFLWFLVTFVSRRMDQLNFPLSPLDLSAGMTSEIIEITRRGKRLYAGWLRRMKSTGHVIYAGLYTETTVPGHTSPCVKVSFPVPKGSAVVCLRPEVQPDGSFRLISKGRRFGDPGFYRLIKRPDGRYSVWNIRTLHEEFHVYGDGEGDLHTDHFIRFLGLPILRLHYKMAPVAVAAIARV